MPVILAHNFPTRRQCVNDSGATSSAEAIFEVKTYTAFKSRYDKDNSTTSLADRRAKEIEQEYS